MDSVVCGPVGVWHSACDGGLPEGDLHLLQSHVLHQLLPARRGCNQFHVE